MTAETAKKIVNHILYKQIIEEIDSVSKQGKDYIYVYIPISDDIQKVLKRDGFTIKDTSDPYRNEVMYRIDW
jgi:GT2 family glycosyltransferase